MFVLKSKFEWCAITSEQQKSVETGKHSEIERLFLVRGLIKNDLEIWHDPFKFVAMSTVVERIKKAVQLEEKVMIYGDYDADGATATAILVRALRRIGANVDFYIPNRFTDGYGPNLLKFQQFIAENYQLVITVDCGISGLVEAKALKDADVDLIITDHHHAKADLPLAVAIIHPGLEEDYPFDKLAGAGVALKIAAALLAGELEEDDYMLAMFGTVGDVVDLVDENRSLVKRGLAAFTKTTLPGVVALLNIIDENQYEADEKTVGFAICPRLNAPGRMEDANLVVDLLLADDEDTAYEIAEEIEYWNNQRKAVTNQIIEEAQLQIAQKDLTKQKAVVLYSSDWHEGVLGIVAAKLVDQLAVAVVILTNSTEGLLKGSARAPKGFDILQALTENDHLLQRYGGHEGAAGMTLATNDHLELETALNNTLTNQTASRILAYDFEITLAELDLKWYNELLQLAPFGQGNKYPIIKLNAVKIKAVKRVGNRTHLKFTVTDDKIEIDAIFFGGADVLVYLTPEAKFDILCEIELNEWNGNKRLQLLIRDIACDQLQLLDLRNQQLNAEFGAKITDAFIVDTPLRSIQEVKLAYKQSFDKDVVLKPLNKMTMPSRDQFIIVYQDVKKHAPFVLTQAHIEYFTKLGIGQAMLLFIIRVFVETGLFSFNDGIVAVLPTDQKIDFTAAPSYINRKEKAVMVEFFELATATEILEFLTTD